MHTLVAPNILNDNSFEYLINQLPDLEGHPEKELGVDLSITEAIDSYGLLGLLELGAHLKNKGFSCHLIPPKNEQVLSVFTSSGFLKFAAESFLALPGHKIQSETDTAIILEITPVESFSDVQNVVALVREKIKLNHFNEDTYTWDNIIVAISEICQNIPEHSKSRGFASTTVSFSRLHKRHIVNIVVMDLGIGIKNSLDEKLSPVFRERWTDRLAIHKTLFEGISRHDDPGRGNGIIRTRELVVEKFRGNMSLRSGTAKLWGKIPSWEIERLLRKPLVYLPGTQINITIPLTSN